MKTRDSKGRYSKQNVEGGLVLTQILVQFCIG